LARSTNIKLSLIGFLCALYFVGFSQDTATVVDLQISNESQPRFSADEPFRLPGHRNPKVAGWLSTAIPGAGQIYNGQWWKVPIIYGGAATLVYFHNMNLRERNLFRDEFRFRLNHNDSVGNERLANWNSNQVSSAYNYYRRNLELVYILSGLLYFLNIIDAIVFAHLATFDVSDNLTMRIEPFALPDFSPFAQTQRMPMQGGLRLTFTLK